MSIQKKISILGATGSIGKSTLEVIKLNSDAFNVVGLTCNTNIALLSEQINIFKPEIVSVADGYKDQLKDLLKGQFQQLTITEGISGNIDVAEYPSVDIVVAAIVGSAGLKPVFSAIKANKDVALANKETLVLAGDIMMKAVEAHQGNLLPLDSEHNAIFQCLAANQLNDIHQIILTASGGPFRTTPYADFDKISLSAALNHPNWSMGKKITIDSATMMNKGLEIIEAKWLFGLEPDQIKVMVHPQSIIHSMVSYKDGSTLAQLGVPDMKTPIANCLGFPNRIKSGSEFLNWADIKSLDFEEPDLQKFPTIQFAFDVLQIGGGAPAALNGANEVLVDLFLKEKISFLSIFNILNTMMKEIKLVQTTISFLQSTKCIEDTIKADQWGRDYAYQQATTAQALYQTLN